eukprot:TRINITY_DN3912_c0_g1_i3.p2 TRINITY_DN3912_c0_g1~~TRINITY_DN3912_c0_g1_i3.p2  ORF type:complete len:222 (+),score=2.36 TRINITY_DN3912_c0_g1_i3:1449-2114(+)
MEIITENAKSMCQVSLVILRYVNWWQNWTTPDMVFAQIFIQIMKFVISRKLGEVMFGYVQSFYFVISKYQINTFKKKKKKKNQRRKKALPRREKKRTRKHLIIRKSQKRRDLQNPRTKKTRIRIRKRKRRKEKRSEICRKLEVTFGLSFVFEGQVRTRYFAQGVGLGDMCTLTCQIFQLEEFWYIVCFKKMVLFGFFVRVSPNQADSNNIQQQLCVRWDFS